MNPDTGAIHQLSEYEQKRHEEFINQLTVGQHEARGNYFIPLTGMQEKLLTPMNAKKRKGWMRNQPCICGSGDKFKKCCWDKFSSNRG